MDEAPGPLHVDPTLVGVLDLGTVEVPYLDLQPQPYMHTRLQIDGAEYAYERSYPVKGGSAVMPAAVAELVAEGKQLIVAERGERYYLYLA